MAWQQWDTVAFADRGQLPTCSGIYVVADASGLVWYVGQATLAGVEVAALRYLDVLDQVPMREAFAAIGEGKRKLTDAAYLRYCQGRLKPLRLPDEAG